MLFFIALSAVVLTVSAGRTLQWNKNFTAPNPPSWPHQFSATIVGAASFAQRPFFARWFYDSASDTDRIDGFHHWQGQEYFAKRIFNHKEEVEYGLFYQLDDVTCISRKLNKTSHIPKPSFKGFQYAGQTLIADEWTHHWVVDETDYTGQYFEIVGAKRIPRRWQVSFKAPHRGFVDVDFHEFDISPQPKYLFNVPPLLKPHCRHVL